MIMVAPWNVMNTIICIDLQIPAVNGEIHCYNTKYCALLIACGCGAAIVRETRNGTSAV
jgi:hypothetical protein